MQAKYGPLHCIPPFAVEMHNSAKQWIDYLFQSAVSSDPKDTHTLYQYANFYCTLHLYSQAEDYLLKSIKADKEHISALSLYVTLLLHCKLYEDVYFIYVKILRTGTIIYEVEYGIPERMPEELRNRINNASSK